MRTRPLLAGAAALALVLSLAACGDDGDDETTDTTSTTEAPDSTTESTEGEGTTEPEETEPDDTTEPEEPVGDDLSGLLLTPEDLGEGFVEGEYETNTEPGPCGGDIDVENPFDSIVGTVLVEEELSLALQHELRTYADEDTAAATLAAAEESLSCGADTTEEGAVLGEPVDVTDDVGAPGFAVELTHETEGVEGGLVAVQVGAVLSVYQFQGSVDAEDGPNPQAVVTANVEQLQAELG